MPMARVVTSKLLKKYSPMFPVFIADAKLDHNQCFGRPMIFDPNISSFDLREKVNMKYIGNRFMIAHIPRNMYTKTLSIGLDSFNV
jgi:hypothetical protein